MSYRDPLIVEETRERGKEDRETRKRVRNREGKKIER